MANLKEPAPAMPGAERLRRIRWRARRGLLENDIVLTRFLDAEENRMSEEDVLALDRLLDLTDPELLDLVLRRQGLLPGALQRPRDQPGRSGRPRPGDAFDCATVRQERHARELV